MHVEFQGIARENELFKQADQREDVVLHAPHRVDTFELESDEPEIEQAQRLEPLARDEPVVSRLVGQTKKREWIRRHLDVADHLQLVKNRPGDFLRKQHSSRARVVDAACNVLYLPCLDAFKETLALTRGERIPQSGPIFVPRKNGL